MRNHPHVPARNQRLAAQFYETAGQVCFLTIRAFRGQSPFIDPALADAVVEMLYAERERSRCYVHIYCLMPDHLQFMLSPWEDGCSVLIFADRFKGRSTNMSWEFGHVGKLWQPRNYDRVVRCEEAIEPVALYILSDPVRHGLAETPEAYRWSGAWDPFPV